MTRPNRPITTLILAVAFALCSLFTSSTARAEWREATTAHFVILSNGREQELINMSRRLESLHWLLGNLTNSVSTSNVSKVRIYLVDSVRAVRRVYDGDGENVAGFYNTSLNGTMAVVPRDQLEFSTVILCHEYAHHFMYQYMNGYFPGWYSEGFAELVSTATVSADNRITYGRPANHRAYELQDERWVPLSRMMAPRSPQDPRAGVANYGQYWLATHYLTLSGQRRGELTHFLTRINTGETEAEAADSFTGGLEQLNIDVRGYFRANRYRNFTVAVPPEALTAPVVRTLRPSEEAIIPLEMQSFSFRSEEEAIALEPQIAALTARFPDEPAVWQAYLRVLTRLERWSDLQAAADRLIALAPNNVLALTARGTAMMELADAQGQLNEASARQARGYFVRANRADPEQHLPLIGYYLSFRKVGLPINDTTLEGLYKAVRLVPREDSVRMMLVGELINQRRLDIAARILRPLAMSPHRGPAQGYALQLLQWVQEGAEGPEPTYIEPTEIVVEDS